MPIYEYECAKCHRRTSVLTTRVSERVRVRCGHCGNRKLNRLMSRFAMPRSEEARLDSLGDASTFSDYNERDPKSIGKVMRKLGREMGDEMSGPDFEQAIEDVESGALDESSDAGDDDF
ncbi:MAG TPA: zinc ribbon domain-containing protein [Candidatus Binataceae bacterium]|nr:zinc ribbon domain-containing protein [Candidatus Binataceae bacterium]